MASNVKLTPTEVKLIDSMGTDLTVVNSAKVSFNKASRLERIEAKDLEELERLEEEGWTPDWEYIYSDRWFGGYDAYRVSEQDQRLIKYLAKHKHLSPFGHCFASFHIKAPVFVRAQLVKHEYLRMNEVSRRYYKGDPEFFMPDVWRKKHPDKKQGSLEEAVEENPTKLVENLYSNAETLYNTMLKDGVAPELARMVLPQSMMTQWYWSGSLDAFANMYNLRAKPDAQKETRQVAELIGGYMSCKFPESWRALTNEKP